VPREALAIVFIRRQVIPTMCVQPRTLLVEFATCAKAPVCSQLGLHKFRHTYATNVREWRAISHSDRKSKQAAMG
jgi:hypothetical protein